MVLSTEMLIVFLIVVLIFLIIFLLYSTPFLDIFCLNTSPGGWTKLDEKVSILSSVPLRYNQTSTEKLSHFASTVSTPVDNFIRMGYGIESKEPPQYLGPMDSVHDQLEVSNEYVPSSPVREERGNRFGFQRFYKTSIIRSCSKNKNSWDRLM